VEAAGGPYHAQRERAATVIHAPAHDHAVEGHLRLGAGESELRDLARRGTTLDGRSGGSDVAPIVTLAEATDGPPTAATIETEATAARCLRVRATCRHTAFGSATSNVDILSLLSNRGPARAGSGLLCGRPGHLHAV
jgi:hypothetical protein